MPKKAKKYFSIAFLFVFLLTSFGQFAHAEVDVGLITKPPEAEATEEIKLLEGEDGLLSPSADGEAMSMGIGQIGLDPIAIIPPDPWLNLEGFEDLLTENLFTGEARFDVPLSVPPGRRGLQPELTLSYSSFKKDYISPYGRGFDLSTSSIFRNTAYGLDELYTRSDFAVKLAGKYSELVLVNASSSLYANKDGNDFNKYYFENGQWRVQDTRGNEFYFGEVATARQVDPEDSSKIYQWMLTRIADPNGNEVDFNYFQDNNQIYLDNIEYAVLDSTEPLFKIDLVYLTKTAGPTSYHPGFPIKTLKLLESVDIQENASSSFVTKKSYELTYNSTSTPISRLTSVTQTADGDSLPAIDFEYYTSGHAVTLLKKIDNNIGGEIHLEYTPSTEYRDIEGKQNFLPFIIQTLSKITHTDTIGNVSSTKNFTYHGGHYFYDANEVQTREYAGFREVISEDSASTTVKTYFHQSEFASDNASSTLLGEFEDHISKKGRVWRQEVYDDQDNLFQSTITKWDKTDLGNDRFFVSQDRATNLTWDGDATHKDSAEEFTYDSFGNVEDYVTWGEVTANKDDGTFTDVGTDKFTTSTTYASNTAENMVSFPSTQTTYEQDGTTKVQEQRIYYDGLALNSITKGNITKQEDWVVDSTYVDVERTYNSFGLVATEKDPRDNTTTYTYDDFDMYAASSTNAKSQETNFTYDYIFGKVKTTTDPNNRVFETVYDGFGRVTEEKVPDLADPSTLVTKTAYTYIDDIKPRSVQQTHHLDASTTVDVYTYFDGFNRKIQERKEAEATDTFAVKDFIYNNIGLPEKESLPYFDTNGSSTSATASSTLYTTFAYDAVHRVETITNAVGSSTNAYSDWKTTSTDANGNTKDTTTDAYGRLAKVEEREGVSTYTTTYKYNGLGNLTKLTDADGNIRNFTYDGLGRRLTAEDLRDPVDGTFGTWTYVYDATSNVTKVTDPKSQVTNFTYDALNRPLTEDYTGDAGTEIIYGYDSGTNGVGRLTSATTTDATTTDVVTAYTYNAVGGVDTETAIIDSTNYVTEYGYDRQGNITLITYPDEAEVKYTYNAAGLPETITKKESGEGSFSDVITNFDYAPTESVTIKEFANGASSTLAYDENELYRLRNITTNRPEGGTLGLATGPKRFAQAELPENVQPIPQETQAATSTPPEVSQDNATSTQEVSAEQSESASSTQATSTQEENTALPQTTEQTTEPIQESATSTVIQESSQEILTEKVEERTENFSPLSLVLPQQEDIEWHHGVPKGSSYNLEVSDSGAVAYSDSNGFISFTPASIIWENGSSTNASKVSFEKRAEGKYQFENAFGTGVSVDVTADARRMRKDVRVDSLASLGEIPPGAKSLEVVFEVHTDFDIPVGSVDSVLPLGSYSFLQVPKAWDSFATQNPEDRGKIDDSYVPEKHIAIPARFFEQDGKLYFAKQVSVDWLSQAEFPVYFDADITYGSFQEFYDGYVWSIETETVDTNKFVTCYADNDNSTRDTYCKVGTVSGSAISYGSAATVDSDIWGPALGACSIGTNKFAVVYADDGAGDDGFVRVGTVSGSSITFGSPVEFSGNNNVENVACAGIDEDKLLISYDDLTDSYTAKAVACTVSGTTPSCGTPEDFDTTDYDGEQYSVAKLDTDKAVTCFESYDLGGQWCAVTTVSGTDLTHGTVTMVSETTNGVGTNDIGVWGTDQFIAAWNEYDSAWEGNAKAASASGTEITLGPEENYNTASAYNAVVVPHTLDKVVFGFSDAGNNWDGVSQYNSIDWGTLALTATSTKDTFCADSCASEAAEAMDAALVDTDTMVICFDDADSTTEGQCVVGTLPESGGGGNSAPTAPTSLETEGQTNPTDITDTTPEFTAVYNDPDSGDIATDYQIQVDDNSDFSSTIWDSTKLSLASSTVEGSRTEEISYAGSVLASSTTYYWRMKLWDDDAEGAWSTATSTFSIAAASNTAPTAPTDLQTEGQTNPTDITDATPEFTAVYNDPDEGDIATDYQLQISTVSDFGTIFWDSGKTALSASTTAGSSTPEISYSGTSTLAVETTYYWRIKLWDDDDAEGAWSTATSTFALAGAPLVLQDITYTYDPVGNITQIIDASETAAARTVDYGYDDLYRITSASSTGATAGDYAETYSYDSIGNITNKSDVGTYLYQETNYANPHAATSVNGVTYSYDNNGNLLSNGNLTLVWDYRNRIASISNSSTSATSTYEYNHNNQRTKKAIDGVDTIYPNRYYEISGSTTTAYIFAGDELVATVEDDGSASSTSFIHADHLQSTNEVTDHNGDLVQTLDYYPYGAERLNSGTTDTARTFIGQYGDDESDLSYLNARYYSGTRGQFQSQDPVFLAIGDPNQIKQITGGLPEQLLLDPQLLNSYAYGRGNPIRYSDPEGECPICIAALGVAWVAAEFGLSAYDIYDTTKTILNPDASLGEKATSGGLTIAGFGLPGGGYGKAGKEALQIGENFGALGTVIENTAGKVEGFTKHGLNQIIDRSVSPQTLQDTVQNPIATLKQAGETTLYLSERAGVVLNKAGKVVTSYTSDSFKPAVKEIVDRAKKGIKKRKNETKNTGG